MSEHNRIAVAFVEGLARGAIEDDLVHPDLDFAAGSETRMGLGQLRMMIGLLARLFPDGLQMTVDTVIEDGDRIALQVRSHGVLDDGAIYANKYHYAMRFRGGRLAEVHEYMDTDLVNRLLRPKLQALMAGPA